MTAYDLIVRDGEAILPDRGRAACDIAIGDGRIAAILAPGENAPAAAEISAWGLVVFPGAVDVHLHLGHGRNISRPVEPIDADRESAAAATGGITCFVPYLMTTDPFEDIFDDVVAVTEAGARIDFAYHFVISTERQLTAVPRYVADYGVPSFKMFMNNRGGEGARLGLPDIDDGFLFRLCETIAASGGMLCPHPEAIEIARVLRDRMQSLDPQGVGGLATWNGTRPPLVEAEAVQRAACIAQSVGAPVYFVHTSSRAALEAALRYRGDGRRVHIETCPHYLTHDQSWAGGDIGKVNPPLREAVDREALWQALLAGDIDTCASDHVHRDVSCKQGGIWNASPGCPGLETLLPVLLSEGHHKRGMSLERIADVTAAAPARLMGMGDRKGTIDIGKDADLTFVDPNLTWRLERSDVISSAGFSIYEGWEFRGAVVHTMSRGRFVLRERDLQDDAVGHGRFVQRRL